MSWIELSGCGLRVLWDRSPERRQHVLCCSLQHTVSNAVRATTVRREESGMGDPKGSVRESEALRGCALGSRRSRRATTGSVGEKGGA